MELEHGSDDIVGVIAYLGSDDMECRGLHHHNPDPVPFDDSFACDTSERLMQQQSDRHIAEDNLAIILGPARIGSGRSK